MLNKSQPCLTQRECPIYRACLPACLPSILPCFLLSFHPQKKLEFLLVPHRATLGMEATFVPKAHKGRENLSSGSLNGTLIHKVRKLRPAGDHHDHRHLRPDKRGNDLNPEPSSPTSFLRLPMQVDRKMKSSFASKV